ncbi:MAG TPA: HisA/HisF-related TIM barrel protein, partial [Candidatus Dormibacteraeota bacterium]|nr:HisA/HisF-related TIM barrel protein [Candidatus Dormibacteraeota bacterium]
MSSEGTTARSDRRRSTPLFELLPAIDLRGGRVVRLVHGRFDRETAYAEDAAETARRFADAGVGWLHVVDLDGAIAGRPLQEAAIRSVVDAVDGRARVQVGGGIRTPEDARRILGLGAARVVVGTRAIEEPAFAAELVGELGAAAVCVALDVRDGIAVGEGWRAG